MKTTSIIAGIVASAVSLISVASAVTVNSAAPGTMLASVGTDQQYLNRNTSGVYNTATTTKYAWGLVARNPHAAGNQTVGWTGYSNDVANSNCCTIYALHVGGGATGKTSCVTGVNGYYTTSVSFTTTEAPSTSSYAAYCRLLASSADRVSSFRVTP